MEDDVRALIEQHRQDIRAQAEAEARDREREEDARRSEQDRIASLQHLVARFVDVMVRAGSPGTKKSMVPARSWNPLNWRAHILRGGPPVWVLTPRLAVDEEGTIYRCFDATAYRDQRSPDSVVLAGEHVFGEIGGGSYKGWDGGGSELVYYAEECKEDEIPRGVARNLVEAHVEWPE